MKTFKEMAQKIEEGKSDYVIYHDTYSSAVVSILDFAEKNGYVLDDLNNYYDGEQVDNAIAMGPTKPKPGKTNKLELDLYKVKNSIYKLQKKVLHAQVYNRETKGNEFELNMYIN